MKQGRIVLFDILKAFSVVSMVAYHAMFDLVVLYGVSAPWFSSREAFVWQQSICWVFILVSGALQPCSRSQLRHALTLLGCAALLTLATAVALPSELIWFGILHLLGCAALLSWALAKPLGKLPALPAAAVSFAVFLLTYQIPRQSWHVPGLFWLGFPDAGFASGDYFPLIPWLFLYWTGLFLWRGLAPRVGKYLQGWQSLPLAAVLSRWCLPIYLLHQPVLLAVFSCAAMLGVLY